MATALGLQCLVIFDYPSSILLTGGATRLGGAWVWPFLNFEMSRPLDLAGRLANKGSTTFVTSTLGGYGQTKRARVFGRPASPRHDVRLRSFPCGHLCRPRVCTLVLPLSWPSRRPWPRRPAAAAAELAGNNFTNAEAAPLGQRPRSTFGPLLAHAPLHFTPHGPRVGTTGRLGQNNPARS